MNHCAPRIRPWTLTPALLVAAALVTAVACAPEQTAAGQVDSGQPLASVATDNLFTPTTYTIAAGQPYTVTMTNAGDAIHNWHILNVRDRNGRDIATPLTTSHKSSSVTFVISKPGVYPYQCDVHPDTMKGTLRVNP